LYELYGGKNGMAKKILSFVYFAITIAILIAALKIVNYLPMALQKDTMRKYNSIEEVKSKLNIRDIYIPSYFPQNLAWPPSTILAQDKPFIAIILEFNHTEKGDIALIISQSVSTNFTPDEKIKILQVNEKVSYPFKGRDMTLEAGVCKEEEPCSRIIWDEGKYRINVTAKSTPPDLMKIAESMIN
jgi:hypothetical protein